VKVKLKEWRLAHGLTQSDIARAADVNPASVWKWENGTMQPRMDSLWRLSNFYKVPISAFVELDDRDKKRYAVDFAIDYETSAGEMSPLIVEYAPKSPKSSAHSVKSISPIKTIKSENTFSRIVKVLPTLSDSELDTIWAIIERLKGE